MDLTLDQLSNQRGGNSRKGGGRNRNKAGGRVARRARSGSGLRNNPMGLQKRQNGGREFGIYVGNLPWSVSWQHLKDMFKPFGTVIYADIATEAGVAGGRSKGWGRVKFATPGGRDRAINAMNGTNVEGRNIEVRYDQKESNGGSRGSSNSQARGGNYNDDGGSRSNEEFGVYCGNLPWSVSWQDLKDLFKQYGNVVYADVATEGGQAGGKSLGWGRVKFSTPGAQNRAIKGMNGFMLSGRPMEVRVDAKSQSGNGAANNRPTPEGFSCYVGNLPWSVKWQELKDLFMSFGHVNHADIATVGGAQGGRSHGWGIVYYANKADRDHAIQQLNGTDWDGRSISVRVDAKQAGNEGGGGGSNNQGSGEYSVYVGNLPWSCDWKMLKDSFSSVFPDVVYADVATQGGAPGARSYGWGTVRFSSRRSRDNAIQRFNGKNMGGRYIEVRVDNKNK